MKQPRDEEASQPRATDALTASERALLRRRTDGLAVFMAGPANVVLQMAHYPVGRGIVESTVHSGSVYHHPFKRFRTTIGFIDIAFNGDDDLRADYRKAVNGSHQHIRSGPDSPVEYNAFDKHLQLWVASCLYYGLRDIFVRMHGPLTDEEENDLLTASRRFGTTLQVPAALWHSDRDAFEAYWAAGMRQVRFDEDTRRYITGALVDFDILPRPLAVLGGPTFRFFNTGFLPSELRDELGLTWSDRRDRVFTAALRAVGTVSRPLPHAVRRVPMNWMTLNIRARRALGRPLV